MTRPQHLKSRTQHIRATWGKRCNIILYMSSEDQLYWKTIRAFQHIHTHHLDDADWFLKADDDTFVVVENLRYGLSKHNTEKPLYFGRRFMPFVAQGYMSGGAGYVLSKEALRRDVLGRQTFHPYPPEYYLPRQIPRPRPWYLIYEHYQPVE
ncbi:hypothetical protein M9458_037417, partial [Cirrhinus mrigala]